MTRRNGHYLVTIRMGDNSMAWCMKCHHQFEVGRGGGATKVLFWGWTRCVRSWKRALARADDAIREAKTKKAKLVAFIKTDKIGGR